MGTKRRLWKIVYQNGDQVYRPETLAAAYRWIDAERANYQCIRSDRMREKCRIFELWVDERDGYGFRSYALIDLAAEGRCQ